MSTRTRPVASLTTRIGLFVLIDCGFGSGFFLNAVVAIVIALPGEPTSTSLVSYFAVRAVGSALLLCPTTIRIHPSNTGDHL
jgi:hypothetical protein